MKRLIFLLIILSLAVWAGVNIAQDPGYMLLAYHQWTLETPLWFGIILWLLLFAILLFVAQIWRGVGSIGAKWHAYRSKKRLTRSNNLTIQAVLETLEGYYPSAEKHFDKAYPNAELPLVNLLGAAFCAERSNQCEARDAYLKKALETSPEAEAAIKLIKIQWLIDSSKWSEATAELERLLLDDPYQKQALTLAQNLYQRLGLWDAYLKIISTLRKRKLIDQNTLENGQLHAYDALLRDHCHKNTLQDLTNFWLTVPTHYQQAPALVLIYSKALLKAEQGDKAVDLLKDTLKKHWDSDLVICFGTAVTSNSQQQLKIAEKWLGVHENDPQLLLTLGRLCIRTNLWAKARSYLEASVNIAPSAVAYQALADLALSHGESEKAAGLYQKALKLVL